jgi:hypothetical protein
MARVYNDVGSLTAVLNEIRRNDIDDFSSIEQIISFQSRIDQRRGRIIEKVKDKLLEEKENLPGQIFRSCQNLEKVRQDMIAGLLYEEKDLEQRYLSLLGQGASFFGKVRNWFKGQVLRKRIQNFKDQYDSRLAEGVGVYEEDLSGKEARFFQLTNEFELAIENSARPELYELNRRKAVLEGLKSQIFGAIGELKVEQVLKNIPGTTVLINDFKVSFNKPLYFKQEDKYISTVQMDHLLITQAGIFIIETKNWSEQSVNSRDMFSPVNQVRRAGYALYVMLSDPEIVLGKRHLWGKQKIPVRNLIVFTGYKPAGEFQYVKILSLNQLEGYIKYFKPVYSPQDTEAIADFFLR